MPTITPTTPHKNACLAVEIFDGSPWAVKNIIPEYTNIITAKAANIIQRLAKNLSNK